MHKLDLKEFNLITQGDKPAIDSGGRNYCKKQNLSLEDSMFKLAKAKLELAIFFG
jgi:hypothetical protein